MNKDNSDPNCDYLGLDNQELVDNSKLVEEKEEINKINSIESEDMILRKNSQSGQPLMENSNSNSQPIQYGTNQQTTSNQFNEEEKEQEGFNRVETYSTYQGFSYPPTGVTHRNSYAYIPVSRKGSQEDINNHNHFQMEIKRPKCPPSEQEMKITTDDLELNLMGYEEIPLHKALYYIAGILTAGIVFLLGKWLPALTYKLLFQPTTLLDAQYILVKNQFGEVDKVKVETMEYGGLYSELFGYSKNRKNEILNEELSNYDQVVLDHVKLIRYRFMNLILDPVTGSFYQLSHWQDLRWGQPELFHSGLDSNKIKERISVFQKNLIEIPQKPIHKLLIDEVLHPFYIFQVFSIILWCFEDYYIYASSIFVISLFSIVTTLIQTKSNWKQITKMSTYHCNVRVYRGKHWITLPSYELVPGDIYEISDPEFAIFPCDSILIQGDCIVGEAMLTGESIPISKTPIADTDLLYNELGPNMSSMTSFSPELSKSLLFSGTHVIRVRGGTIPAHINPDRERDRRAVAMVLRTGFNTAKGSLIRSILFPRPNLFQFYRDSFYFIGVMFLLALIGFGFTIWKLIELGMDSYLIWVRTLDIVTIVVPPALPATMSVGMTFAIARLKMKQIFCIAPTRINACGKVDVVCFDKTGTLTEEGLDVLGIQLMEKDQLLSLNKEVPEFNKDDANANLSLLNCLATCHSIKVVEDELLGDPLDLKMFEFTGWTLEEGGSTHAAHPLNDSEAKRHSTQFIPSMVRPPNQPRFSMDDLLANHSYLELGILRSFEFVSNLRRMSVIVKKLGSATTEVYCKGAPESIASLCIPETLPKDFHDQLEAYTKHGYRVIACAGKSLKDLSFVKVHKVNRESMESDLHFLGFIIFENKLKPQTIPAIQVLKQANIRQIMCTGDNLLTAISVAKQCAIVNENALVFVPKWDDVAHQLTWISVNHTDVGRNIDQPVLLDAVTLRPPAAFSSNYAIALSGDTFRRLIDHATTNVIERTLVQAQVYARMAPEDKQELVERLQTIDYCVSFCGDGANDCGALKAADVGLSLSEAEASVAAPFTSKVQDISSVPLIIREGRAALVTSFACFKYMGLYSIIQFTSIILLYFYGSNLGDYQFLYFDLFVILPVAVAMGRTLPYDSLHPKPPTASLVSTKMLVSFIGQCGVQIVFQIIGFCYLTSQNWFEEPPFDPEEKNIASQVNTTLFIISSYQYLWGAIVFSVGYPYRKELYTNIPFVITLGILLMSMIWCNLGPVAFFENLLELVYIPFHFRGALLGLAFLNLAVAYIYERYVTLGFIKIIDLIRYGVRSLLPKKTYPETVSLANGTSGSSTPTAVDGIKTPNTKGKFTKKRFRVVEQALKEELMVVE